MVAAMGFAPDPMLATIAEGFSLTAVDLARDHFSVDLDFSDESIRSLEEVILTRFHDDLVRKRPSDEKVRQFAQIWGSYLGEVLRRNHAAEWGATGDSDQRMPSMRLPDDTTFWPWMRTLKRLVNGPEDNVWVYFSVLLEKK
jgi:hypothetical protein